MTDLEFAQHITARYEAAVTRLDAAVTQRDIASSRRALLDVVSQAKAFLAVLTMIDVATATYHDVARLSSAADNGIIPMLQRLSEIELNSVGMVL